MQRARPVIVGRGQSRDWWNIIVVADLRRLDGIAAAKGEH
jgi:hypothetical protein